MSGLILSPLCATLVSVYVQVEYWDSVNPTQTALGSFGKYRSKLSNLVYTQYSGTEALTFVIDSMPEHPESFPVNALVPIPGTPLEENEVMPENPQYTPTQC